MIDDFVRISDLSQGLAFVTLLPTRLLAGPFAQTRHPRWLLAGPFAQTPHPRRLLQPSLDGGLPLFELFKPSRRSSSAIWALSAPTSAMSSSRDSSAADSAFIESLNRSQIPLSRKFCTVDCRKLCSLTWAGQLRCNIDLAFGDTAEHGYMALPRPPVALVGALRAQIAELERRLG